MNYNKIAHTIMIVLLLFTSIKYFQLKDKYNKIPKTPTYILVQGTPQETDKRDKILIDYYVDKYSKQYGVDSSLIHAIIKHESGYKKNAVSDANCIGLMQISSIHGCPNPFDIRLNIQYGTRLIAGLIKKYDGNVSKALWAYNAGSTNVDNGRIPSSTRKYARNIIKDKKWNKHG